MAARERNQTSSAGVTPNYPLHGTGRSGLHVLNHRARPARERGRYTFRIFPLRSLFLVTTIC